MNLKRLFKLHVEAGVIKELTYLISHHSAATQQHNTFNTYSWILRASRAPSKVFLLTYPTADKLVLESIAVSRFLVRPTG